MGQQQLLLIVLGAIIVGFSVVIGINMFDKGAVQGNVDNVTQDVMTIASRAQQWWRKPAQLGGGGRSFTGVDQVANGLFTRIGFPDSTINGTYAITIQGDTAITIVGTGIEDGDNNGTNITVTTIASSEAITSTVVAD